MQISSNHNLAIIAGYPRQDQSCQTQSDCKAQQRSANAIQAYAQPAIVDNNVRTVRPAVKIQPMFDQSLTYRGEQARRTYQDVELGGEAELMQRLDVRV